MRKIVQRIVPLLVILFLLNFTLNAQNQIITGTVTGEGNKPLPGATITLKGTSKAVTTNDEGKYSIEAKMGDEIVVSSVGHLPVTLKVNKAEMNVALVLDKNELEEVVITAMDQKRNPRELGYSVQTIDGDEIKESQRDNFLLGMQGRIAGLTITPTSGLAGASAQIVLRGFNSMSQDNSPLFVVDGVVMDNTTISTAELTGTTENRREDFSNRISDINPNDIASITVLKGPEATALYGSQAGSGAIIITTKKSARKKGVGIFYDNSLRLSKVVKYPEVYNGYSGGSSNGIPSNVFSYFGPKYADTVQLYDNVKNFFQNAFTQTHNLSLDFAASQISTFRVSGSLVNQNSIVPNNEYYKRSLRVTNTTKITKWMTVTPSVSYIYTKNNKVLRGASAFMLNLLAWPANNDIRNYQTDDGLKVPLFLENPNSEIDNPFYAAYKNPGQDETKRLTTTLSVDITPFQWLTVSGRFGYDTYNSQGYQVYDSMSYYVTRAQKGLQRNYTTKYFGYNHTITATARKKFGDFTTRLMVGTMWQDYERQLWSVSGNNLKDMSRRDSANTDPTTRTYLFNQVFRNGSPNLYITRQIAYFGEAMIGFKNSIFLTYSHRFEESSVLPPDFRNFNYPAGSLSIILSDLLGIKSKSLNFWKIRASLANTARQIPPYANQSLFNQHLGNGGGFYYDFTNNNPYLKPERQSTREFGTEFRLFNSRVNLDATYYDTRNKDVIVSAFRISYGTGFVLNTLNVGATENKGIEFTLSLEPVRTKDFTWISRFNFNKMWNKITELPANVPEFYLSDTWMYGNARGGGKKGMGTTTITGYGYLRDTVTNQVLINPTTGLPVIRQEFIMIGDRNPNFTLGWGNYFTYKNFTLNMLWDLKVGGDIFNATEAYLTRIGKSMRTADRETPRIVDGILQDGFVNDPTTTQRTKNNIVVTPYYNSTFYASTSLPEEEYVQKNVNWFRLRDVTLAYQFDKNTLRSLKRVKSLGLFITVTDPILFTNYLGADPQVNSNGAGSRGVGGFGMDYGNVGLPLGFNFGLKIGL
ncbi:MAG: SusC/RagA family TonB-linked outer membrane protein [Chitinophagaceae bacterium]|nr:SusC/RagA family TonB-linked outer membrane protein [Chitinophagaceae bacterium]